MFRSVSGGNDSSEKSIDKSFGAKWLLKESPSQGKITTHEKSASTKVSGSKAAMSS